MSLTSIKAIAYYLPQYHPIPENDEWWGKGFTEWTNVVNAKPLFNSHYQPRLPADLGFYDLRVPEVREQQAALARSHGIYGFCYYHYWFGQGKQLLERPISEVLASGKPDFPFMFCWANETWKGIWFGKKGATLIEQTYPGIEDYKRHFLHLLPAFSDDRYIKIDNKPVFNIYMPGLIPDLRIFVDTFREMARLNGLDGLYLLASRVEENWDPREHGFDGVIGSEFFRMRYAKASQLAENKFVSKMKRITPGSFWKNFTINVEKRTKPIIVEYETAIKYLISEKQFDFDYFPCVVPDWDNSPRAGMQSVIFKNSTPALWEKHLLQGIEKVKNYPDDHKLIFIKSWNEWAESNYLEPDARWGHQYIEVVKKVLAHG